MQLQPGTTLQNGKYKILCSLGQGGFGITYEAEQVNLGRKVAMKEFFMKEYCNRGPNAIDVSVPSTGSQELVSRFKNKFLKEAKMIASLDDPNIVRIHDVFEENCTAYYVMEFLAGGSLADKCGDDGKALSEEDGLKYTRQIASALDYLHTLPTPMNHLDIKPSNVLLNAKGQAVLIDFGISKLYDVSGSQTSSTPVGISHGYSPLEQYREGGVSVFSPTTDIYSLGATLYRMVTGLTPPQASDILVDGLPDLPETLSSSTKEAISAAMQPRPKDRPQCIAAFLSILDSNVASSKLTQTPITKKSPSIDDDETIVGGNASGNIVGLHQNHQWVDMGLPSGTKWATCNLGASSPEDYGSYFSWGETQPKETYSWKTYRFQNRLGWLGSVKGLSKYNTSVKYGDIDGLTTLDPSDDPARAQWGGSWRLPTQSEILELLDTDFCTWARTRQGNRNGYRVTSKKNGNSIFLPAAGRHLSSLLFPGTYGYYWSSDICNSVPDGAYMLYLEDNNTSCIYEERCFGQSIRPVTD